MFDFAPPSVTQVAEPIHNWAAIAAWDPPNRSAPVLTTEFVIAANDAFNDLTGFQSTPGTDLVKSAAIPKRRLAEIRGEAREATEVESVSQQRIKLLALKYAGKAQSEQFARLAILDAKIARLAPRVTDGQVVALEQALTLHEEMSSMLTDVFEQLDQIA